MAYNPITAQIEETAMNCSTTLSGAQLLSCELDAACPSLDCDALIDELNQISPVAPETVEVVAHFCGLEYIDKLTPEKPPD